MPLPAPYCRVCRVVGLRGANRYRAGQSRCFGPQEGQLLIRQDYAYFDSETGQVKTLELENNQCRERNGEKPLKYEKCPIAALSAYMAFTSRGKKINVAIPDDQRARAAYEEGKQFYYPRRGQLNMSCATCHVTGY